MKNLQIYDVILSNWGFSTKKLWKIHIFMVKI